MSEIDTESKDLAICPSCDITYHKQHLQQWLQDKVKCPNCKEIFPFAFMKVMRPTGNKFQKESLKQNYEPRNSNEERSPIEKVWENKNTSSILMEDDVDAKMIKTIFEVLFGLIATVILIAILA